MKENELYVKREKCSFAQHEMSFLGHIVGGGKVKMDRGKIQAIMDWEPPTKITKLRSFIGLVNYYMHFIRGYSTIITSLIDMLKNEKTWE